MFEEAHVLSERQLRSEMQQAISRLTELENSLFMMATHNQEQAGEISCYKARLRRSCT